MLDLPNEVGEYIQIARPKYKRLCEYRRLALTLTPRLRKTVAPATNPEALRPWLPASLRHRPLWLKASEAIVGAQKSHAAVREHGTSRFAARL